VILDCLQPAASVYWHRTFVGIIVTTFEHPLRGKSFVAIIGAVRKRPPLRKSYAGHFIADSNIAVALLTQEECDQQTGRDARDRSEQPQPSLTTAGGFGHVFSVCAIQHPTGCRHACVNRLPHRFDLLVRRGVAADHAQQCPRTQQFEPRHRTRAALAQVGVKRREFLARSRFARNRFAGIEPPLHHHLSL
jgi:hypothetical protein